jgi:tetratricopeptide (TPR) repeat protein
LRTATYFQVLEVPDSADKKAVKAAYGRLSKDFHPDRFFGKRLGSFKVMLSEIFDLASSAKETLLDPERREAYVESLPGKGSGGGSSAAAAPPPAAMKVRSTTAPPAPPPPPSLAARTRAAELFEEACMDHVSGELTKALEKFSVAIGVDPQARYLRRAAECAMKAQELRVAEEYAKKATEMDAHNAASHRILGRVQAAAGRPAEARLRFEQARRLDPDNPHIAAELRELDDSLR